MSRTQERRADPLSRSRPIFQLVGPAVLALAAVFAGLGFLWHKAIPVTYEIDSTQIILVHPQKTDNSYTYFPKSTIMTAWVVTQQVSQAGVRAQIVRQGGLDTYTASVPNDGNQWVPLYQYPTISFTVTTTDAEKGLRTATLVNQTMKQELNDLQVAAGAPSNTLITMNSLATPQVIALHGRPSRALAGILVLSLWLALMIVRFARRRLFWREPYQQMPRVDLLPREAVSAPDREEHLVRS
jgi:hypothetical protein